MTLKRHLILIAASACSMLTAACVTSGPPPAPVQAPQREMPATAVSPCSLPLLPADATVADLERVFTERGVSIIACDAARQLAVDVHAAEHADEERWLAEIRRMRLPFWRRLLPPDA